MKVLARNKQPVWFSNLLGTSMPVDENGDLTGSPETTYSTPEKLKMSMSISSGANNLGSQGMALLKAFGITTAYTHRMVTDDLKCPVNEESRIWYGIDPGTPENPVPHNFQVVRKAKSLNHLIYYLKECDISNADT